MARGGALAKRRRGAEDTGAGVGAGVGVGADPADPESAAVTAAVLAATAEAKHDGGAAAWRAAAPCAATATIRLTTASAAQLVGEGSGPPAEGAWHGRAAGQDAADRRGDAYNAYRLFAVGKVRVRLQRARFADARAEMVRLCEPTRATDMLERQGKSKVARRLERRIFHNMEGEPGGSGLVPVGRLQDSFHPSQPVSCISERDMQIVDACAGLVLPFEYPWKLPMARVIIPAPDDWARVAYGEEDEHEGEAGGEHDHEYNEEAMPEDDNEDAECAWTTLDIRVYLSRLSFELIAMKYLKVILTMLNPVAPLMHPRAPPSYAPTFARSKGALDADPYTLSGLLQHCENVGYREMPRDAVDGLAIELFPYQRQTLAWMVDQESMEGGLNATLWERREWLDRARGGAVAADQPECCWAFPMAGELRLDAPPVCHGGLLAEEMGLGKTVEIVALSLWDRRRGYPGLATEHAAAAAKAAGLTAAGKSGGGMNAVLASSRATLVVAPLTLVAQWASEIAKCATGVTVAIHDPFDRSSPTWGFKDGSKLRAEAERLATHDFVLTSYAALEAEAAGAQRGKQRGMRSALLRRVAWRRIVLDGMFARVYVCACARAHTRLTRARDVFRVSGDSLQHDAASAGVRGHARGSTLDSQRYSAVRLNR